VGVLVSHRYNVVEYQVCGYTDCDGIRENDFWGAGFSIFLEQLPHNEEQYLDHGHQVVTYLSSITSDDQEYSADYVENAAY
jgi:hypothetical protein